MQMGEYKKTAITAEPVGDPHSDAAGKGGWGIRHLLATLRTDLRRMFSAGVFHVLIMVIGVRGAGFIQQIGLARILTPDELGRAVFVFRFLSMITILADLGICTSVLKYAAEPVSIEEKKRIYRTAITYVSFISLAVTSIYVLGLFLTEAFGNGPDMVYPMLIGAIYIPLAALAKIPPLYLQAQKQIKEASMISGAVHLCLLGFILGGAYFYRFWGYLIFIVAGQAVGLMVFLLFTREHLAKVRSDLRVFKELLHFGFFSMLANFSGIINATLGVLLLKWLGFGYDEVAIYGVASVVINGIRLIPQSLLRTAFPYLVSVKDDPRVLRNKTEEIVKKQGAVVLAMAVLVSSTGYWLVPLLFGAQYRASWPSVVILSAMLVFWAVGAGYGQLQLAVNRVKTNFAISFCQLVANISLAFVLIPAYGAEGAAGALCISYFLHCVLLVLSGRRTLREIGG